MAFKFNPLTGDFDLVNRSSSGSSFDPETILTHSLNPFGLTVQWFDPQLNAYYNADDIPVTDEQGNLVTT